MIDPQLQEKAKVYARIKHRLLAAELIISGIAFVFVLVSGLGVWLRDVVSGISPDPFISTFLYFVIGILAYALLFAPSSYYSGFVLPHRYGLSVQGLGSWLMDTFKGGALTLLLGGLVIEVIYFLLRVAPGTWWLIVSVFLLLFTVLLANLAPILIFPLFFKFKPLEDKELVARLMALAAKANTRVNGVYTMLLSDKTTAANAAFMGLGNTKRIVLGDTLYNNFTTDEIETVMAHELGHQVHNDIVSGIAVQTLLTLVWFFLADQVMRLGVTVFHLQGISDLAGMPLLGLALGVLGFITMPLGNWYSRVRETNADKYALETTRNPQAFISAFEKLANQNLSELDPEPWVEWLLYDHPSIGKRVAMGKQYTSHP